MNDRSSRRGQLRRATMPHMRKAWALAVIPVALVVGCGSPGPAHGPTSGEGAAAYTDAPADSGSASKDQLRAAVRDIDTKLGCPDALVSSSNAPGGGQQANCKTDATQYDYDPQAGMTQSYFDVSVFSSAQARDQYLSYAAGFGFHTYQVKGQTPEGYGWIVDCHENADNMRYVMDVLHGGEPV